MNTEIITAEESLAAELTAQASRINQTIDLITQHEEAFQEGTLEPRLQIGLEIAKAMDAFGMTVQESGKLGGEAKASVSRRDTLAAPIPNALGFSAWISRNIPRLNRTTAYKYATAFRSLGLSLDAATPSAIRNKIKDLRHAAGKASEPMPTLASLYKAGAPPKNTPLKITDSPGDHPDQKLRDAREYWTLWIEKGEQLVNDGRLDDLDKPGLKQVQEFNLWLRDRLTARLK